MKHIILIILFLIQGCGKKSNFSDIQKIPDPTRRIQPASTFPRIRTSASCYVQNAGGTFQKTHFFKGTFAVGSIFNCRFGDGCVVDGRYITYLQGSLTCLTKRGFESEFTLCGESIFEWVKTPLGTFTPLEVTTNKNSYSVYCDRNIEKILLPP